MKISQVAAQLFTLRDHIKTPKDIAATLRRVRKMGYQAVQVSGMGPIPEAELMAILQGEGLICCATHEPATTILEKPEAVVERLRKLSCQYTAYPWPAGIDFSKAEEVRKLAAGLNAAGKVLHAAGQVLTYHNHDLEFRRLEGKPALEIIYAETDPLLLQGEIDTYWVKVGGDDPVAWCARLKKRLPLLHLKDGRAGADGKYKMTEIGSGILPWREIIQAAEASGCRWFIVEQDGDWKNNDPFLALEISFNYIGEHLCS